MRKICELTGPVYMFLVKSLHLQLTSGKDKPTRRAKFSIVQNGEKYNTRRINCISQIPNGVHHNYGGYKKKVGEDSEKTFTI